MTAFKLPFFSKGEISPKLYGRVDSPAYQSGLKTARNAIVSVGGGVMNRPGTIMIGPAKFGNLYTRLIPFAFRTNDTHMLEFGQGYMRVIREDFYQTELAPKTITNIAVGASVIVTTDGAHGYDDDKEVVIEDVVGTTEVNDGRFGIEVMTSTTFRLKSVWTGDYLDGSSFTDYVSGGTVDAIYEIETPYLAEDLPTLKFAQSADILTLVHPLYPPKELKRFGLANWELDDIAFETSTAYPTDIGISANTTGTRTVEYQVTAIDKTTNIESFPGVPGTAIVITDISKTDPVVITTDGAHGILNEDEVVIRDVVGTTELNDRRFRAVNTTTDTLELLEEDGTAYSEYVSGGTVTPTFIRISNSAANTDNTLTWTAVEGAYLYDVYRQENGLFSYIGETEKTTFTDNNIEVNAEENPPSARNPFRLEGQWPGAVGFYQQRRIFGGSLDKPATWEASQTGDFNNFGRHSPLKDNDAISYTLASQQLNQIKHFLPTSTLQVFTTGNEWTVASGEDVPFSPYTAKATPKTNWGIAEHRPFLVGTTALYVQEDNRTVRAFRPSRSLVETDSSVNLSISADHIFDYHAIKDWALARAPYSAVVMTRTDGQAAVLTYDEEQEVSGWTRWDTQGTFETVGVVRVCVEHETPEPDDGIYFVVKRVLNGRTMQTVERLHNRRLRDVRDAFFVDCGRSYDHPLQITNIDLRIGEASILIYCPNHGLEPDEVIQFTDITWYPEVDDMGNETQPDQLNDNMYVVGDVTEDTFTFKLLQVGGDFVAADSSWKGYVSGGAVRLCTNELTNLDWLEGQTVSILADSYPITGTVVTNGTVTLPGLAGRVHVGLPYTCDIETLPFEPTQMGSRTIQGKQKKVPNMIARVDKSREAWFGPSPTNLVPMKRAPFTEISPALFTGDRELQMPAQWDGEGSIFFRVREPLPFTLLAVFPEVVT